VEASVQAEDHQADHVLDGQPDTYWAPPEGTEQASLTLDLQRETSFDHIVLQEYWYSQRVERFELEYLDGDTWKTVYAGTVIGHKRICRFPAVKSRYIRLQIQESRWCPQISSIRIYLQP